MARQEEEDDFPEVPQRRPFPPKRKGGFFRTLIIMIILLIIVGAIFYIWVSLKHPEWLAKEPSQGTQNNQTTILVPSSDAKSSTLMWIIFILSGALILLVGYLIYKGLNKGKIIEGTKIPVAPDRAIALFKEHFSMNNNIPCVFDRKHHAYQPSEEKAIKITDKLPYYHTATGDNFLLLEIEVLEGAMQGIHTVIIPIDKGEAPIKTGYYRIDTHTPKFQFHLNRVNYPMSSLQDKQDRIRMAVLDQIDSDKAGDVLKSMLPQQPAITTPLDQFNEETGAIGGVGSVGGYSQPYRRRYTPRRRYYGRRYY